MKKVYLIRHAKAEQNGECKDFDRKIIMAGKEDLKKLFKKLKSHTIKPDKIIASPAKRTAMTAKRVAKFLNFKKKDIIYIDKLYGANANEILTLLQGLDTNTQEIVIVGHNPAMADLAELLSNKDFHSFATSTMLGLEFDIDTFSKLQEHSGKILFLECVRGIKS